MRHLDIVPRRLSLKTVKASPPHVLMDVAEAIS
jgi:hypothetical protein